MDNTIQYKNHFDRELAFDLINLEAGRRAILNKVITAKALNILTVTLFLSVFMGFLNAFPFDEFEFKFFVYFIRGFFYLVLGIVVFSILYKAIRYLYLLKGDNETIKNKKLLYGYTAIASLTTITIAWIIGKFYLGTEVFTFKFFSRYFIAIISLIALGLLSNYFGSFEKKFNKKFKTEYLPRILSFFNKNIQYSPDEMIGREWFEQSSLFRFQNIHSYTGSDLVKGKYGEGEFSFSELYVREITRTKSGGKTETKISDLFKGLFYIADFNKSFKGRTLIFPDYARQALGSQFGEMLNSVMAFNQTNLVALEDVEFEKKFAVYSTDQVEARYILSPTMIEHIKTIQTKLEKDIYLSFINNKVFVAIPSDMDSLSPIIFHNMTTFETIEPIYHLIGSMMEIARDLKLNTRIWGDVN